MMLRPEADRILLSRGWLIHMPSAVQQEVLRRIALREYQARDMVFRQGDEPGGMYGLVEGTLCVSLAPNARGPYSASFVNVGSWIGESAAITHQPRRVSAFVRTNTLLAHLPLAAIRELTAAEPGFWRYMAINVTLNLDVAFKRFDDLLIPDPRVRVAATLLRLGGFETDPLDPLANREIPMTQSEIAELTRLTRNGLAGVLSRLEGMIALRYGRIDITDPKALMEVVRDWL